MDDKTDDRLQAVRDALNKLFQDAGYEHEDLLQWADEIASRSEANQAEIERLQAENDRLKRELSKQRAALTGSMSSRLKDALRE